MQIGYLGLGAMGGALARRLSLSHKLVVCDLDESKVAAFEKLGAIRAASGAELARTCDVIMMCLPRSSDVRSAIFGKGGVAEGCSPGKIVIDQTSGDPAETADMARQLLSQSVTMLDIPVSGGVRGADAGSIALMASGPRAARQCACQPSLR